MSDEALARMIAVKTTILAGAPSDADHGELRDVLFAAFEKLWEPPQSNAAAQRPTTRTVQA